MDLPRYSEPMKLISVVIYSLLLTLPNSTLFAAEKEQDHGVIYKAIQNLAGQQVEIQEVGIAINSFLTMAIALFWLCNSHITFSRISCYRRSFFNILWLRFIIFIK